MHKSLDQGKSTVIRKAKKISNIFWLPLRSWISTMICPFPVPGNHESLSSLLLLEAVSLTSLGLTD